MLNKRSYYARLTYGDEGPDIYSWSVIFPDLPGCLTCADTKEEAIYWAKDALEFWIDTVNKDCELPPPSRLDELENRRYDSYETDISHEFVLIEI